MRPLFPWDHSFKVVKILHSSMQIGNRLIPYSKLGKYTYNEELLTK